VGAGRTVLERISQRLSPETYRHEHWQGTFHEYLDNSPKAYLTEVRMRRARDELRSADPRMVTVGQVARRLGFSHRGRFAQQYRHRYGESPSVTLRK
jgi:transcriptional regulator GlxA family with amidase domain